MSMWTTKEGETFPIAMMGDVHLNNSILMMRRRGYITTIEAGNYPTDPRERIVWASKPASAKLDALAMERLDRIETGRTVSEADALTMRIEYGRGTTRYESGRNRYQPPNAMRYGGGHLRPDSYRVWPWPYREPTYGDPPGWHCDSYEENPF